MTIVDLILLVLLFLFVLRGFFKGLFREIFSLLGLFVGLMVAVHFGEPVSALWQDYWRSTPIVPKFITFTLLFFAVYFTFNLAGRFLHHAAKFSLFAASDRVGGLLLGGGKGAVLLALIVFFLGSLPLMKRQIQQSIDNSYFAPSLYRFGQGLAAVGRDRFFSHGDNGR